MLAINDARLSAPGDLNFQLAAAHCANELLSIAQTNRHLDKTLAHFTYDMGSQGDEASARLALASFFEDTAFAGALEKKQKRGSHLSSSRWSDSPSCATMNRAFSRRHYR
jgi:hypothetical protein